ncbi:MAG: hypothetical protein QXU92_02940 [Candidatus Diapherotrites archaeon]
MKRFFLFLFLFVLCSFSLGAEMRIISISDVSSVPSKIYSGDFVTITFNVKNINAIGVSASDVNVFAVFNENFFVPVKSFDSLGVLNSGSSKTSSLSFKVKDETLPGNYRLPILVSYFVGNTKNSYFVDLNFFVSACNDLKVTDVRLSNSTPHIGDSLVVSAKVSNPCKVSVRNAFVELRPVTNPTLAPFSVSESVVRLGVLGPLSSQDVSFTLGITDKVDAKPYVFTLFASCDLCVSSSNSFSFLVLGKPELVISNIDYSVENKVGASDKQVFQGSVLTFSVQLDNIGKEKAKAVEVSVDFKDGVEGISRSFLGNIDVDDSGAAVFTLNVLPTASVGYHNALINVKYLDELNVERSFSTNYSIYVSPQPPTSPVFYIVILLLVLAVLVVIYFIVRFVFRQLAIRNQSR